MKPGVWTPGTWAWEKLTDEDGHPYWKGRWSKGGSVTIWRAGGDTGDFIHEGDDSEHERRKTLAGAKRRAQEWAENQQ